MNRFAAWNTFGPSLNDPEGRYRVFYGRKPAQAASDALTFNCVSTGDAHDPPEQWPPTQTWDRFVKEHNAYMRRSNGTRIQGWGPPGNKRYAVNLGLPLPWGSISTEIQRMAREVNHVAGIHYDSISIRPPWMQACAGLYDPTNYEANSHRIAAAATPPASGGGVHMYYSPLTLLSHMQYVKCEGFRFYPRFWTSSDGWSGTHGEQKTWETYWSGAQTPRQYGIQELEAAGKVVVIEAVCADSWGRIRRDAYALMAVATVCLATRSLLAFHGEFPNVSPVWTKAHEKAWQLTDPTGPAEQTSKGTWVREFQNGIVTVNPTARPVGNVAANSASIVVNTI